MNYYLDQAYTARFNGRPADFYSPGQEEFLFAIGAYLSESIHNLGRNAPFYKDSTMSAYVSITEGDREIAYVAFGRDTEFDCNRGFLGSIITGENNTADSSFVISKVEAAVTVGVRINMPDGEEIEEKSRIVYAGLFDGLERTVLESYNKSFPLTEMKANLPLK